MKLHNDCRGFYSPLRGCEEKFQNFHPFICKKFCLFTLNWVHCCINIFITLELWAHFVTSLWPEEPGMGSLVSEKSRGLTIIFVFTLYLLPLWLNGSPNYMELSNNLGMQNLKRASSFWPEESERRALGSHSRYWKLERRELEKEVLKILFMNWRYSQAHQKALYAWNRPKASRTELWYKPMTRTYTYLWVAHVPGKIWLLNILWKVRYGYFNPCRSH